MKKHQKGFTLIQLLISIVLSAIVMISVYRYWIKSVGTMSTATKISSMRRQISLALSTTISELKLSGYNPMELLDNNNKSLFKIADHPDPFNELTYSVFNNDPAITYCSGTDTATPPYSDMACDPNCAAAKDLDGIQTSDGNSVCCCKRFYEDSGRFMFQYWDLSTNSAVELTLLRNACIRFLFWDRANNSPCFCQDGLRCDDANSDSTCDDSDGIDPPSMLKVIVATTSNDALLSSFDAQCSNSALKNDEYVRVEKTIYLTNLR